MRVFPGVLGFVLFFTASLRADIGILLSESTSEGVSEWTNAGHAAIYLSHICPASAVQLRPCKPGEPGAVLSNYMNFQEARPYEWNVVSRNVFLYGVEDEENRLLYASPALRRALQERFRVRQLGELCPGPPCASEPRANWRDLVAATFTRDIYLFEARTTLEQDLKFIVRFNASPNVGRYNGITRNCADFAREVINFYFPGAARPDHINDFGMTSPKAISKSFDHYAKKRPELQFHVRRFSQTPGDFKRSRDCRKGTEVAFREKKWLLPMLLRSHELGLFAASYLLTGQFNPEEELRRRPSEEIASADMEINAARSGGDSLLVLRLQGEKRRNRDEAVGTANEWKVYEDALPTLVNEAVASGLLADKNSLSRLVRDLDKESKASLDPNGGAWLELKDARGRERSLVGISVGNILAPESHPQLAYLIMLMRTDIILKSSLKNRELLPEFKRDWELLRRARSRAQVTRLPLVLAASFGF